MHICVWLCLIFVNPESIVLQYLLFVFNYISLPQSLFCTIFCCLILARFCERKKKSNSHMHIIIGAWVWYTIFNRMHLCVCFSVIIQNSPYFQNPQILTHICRKLTTFYLIIYTVRMGYLNLGTCGHCCCDGDRSGKLFLQRSLLGLSVGVIWDKQKKKNTHKCFTDNIFLIFDRIRQWFGLITSITDFTLHNSFNAVFFPWVWSRRPEVSCSL